MLLNIEEVTLQRYYAKADEEFFRICDKELAKINIFFSGSYAKTMNINHEYKVLIFFYLKQKNSLKLKENLKI